MGIVIGIDVGSTTTKIVGMRDGKLIQPMAIRATDPVASLFGAFGRYIYDNGFALDDVEQVMITGVGTDHINGDIYGRPTRKVSEFICDGLGAKYEMAIDNLIVVSMGTGTTLVRVKGSQISHLGGLSMGGGTLVGLSSLLLKTNDVKRLVELANNGDVTNVNLQIGDICKNDIEGLPKFATASFLAKVNGTTPCDEDLAIGICYLVLQTIGSAAVISAKGCGVKDFVLIGNLSRLPQCKEVYEQMEELYGVRFHIPTHSQFCTAIGAALVYTQSKE